jgi:hypothetical protein
MDLEEVLGDQRDLVRLCADRPLNTVEIFPPNAYYGNALVLKRYAGLPPDYPLRAVVPHGVYGHQRHVWDAEIRVPLPAVLCYTAHKQREYQAATRKFVIPSAHPYLYLLRLVEKQPLPERSGTIVFPSHSSHHVTADADFEGIAESLARLSDEFLPVTVCMYWRDFNLGHHRPFAARGMRIVSAGHIFDPHFLYRLHHLCSMHRFACSDTPGSYVMLAVKSGCSFFALDPSQGKDSLAFQLPPPNPPGDRSSVEVDVQPARLPDLKRLFGEARGRTTPEQLRAVDYYLGAAYLRSQEALRTELKNLERLDWLGFAVPSATGHRRWVVPAHFVRLLKRAALAARRSWRDLTGSGRP